LVAADERGDPLTLLMRDPEVMKEILEKWKNGQHPIQFDENGLHTVYNPFWANLPHTDIFLAFMPDLLHQVHKGVLRLSVKMKWTHTSKQCQITLDFGTSRRVSQL
jgi:hypothetical protein